MRNETAGALRQVLERLGYKEDDFIEIAGLISDEVKWNESILQAENERLKEEVDKWRIQFQNSFNGREILRG